MHGSGVSGPSLLKNVDWKVVGTVACLRRSLPGDWEHTPDGRHRLVGPENSWKIHRKSPASGEIFNGHNDMLVACIS